MASEQFGTVAAEHTSDVRRRGDELSVPSVRKQRAENVAGRVEVVGHLATSNEIAAGQEQVSQRHYSTTEESEEMQAGSAAQERSEGKFGHPAGAATLRRAALHRRSVGERRDSA